VFNNNNLEHQIIMHTNQFVIKLWWDSFNK